MFCFPLVLLWISIVLICCVLFFFKVTSLSSSIVCFNLFLLVKMLLFHKSCVFFFDDKFLDLLRWKFIFFSFCFFVSSQNSTRHAHIQSFRFCWFVCLSYNRFAFSILFCAEVQKVFATCTVSQIVCFVFFSFFYVVCLKRVRRKWFTFASSSSS